MLYVAFLRISFTKIVYLKVKQKITNPYHVIPHPQNLATEQIQKFSKIGLKTGNIKIKGVIELDPHFSTVQVFDCSQ